MSCARKHENKSSNKLTIGKLQLTHYFVMCDICKEEGDNVNDIDRCDNKSIILSHREGMVVE